MKKLILLLVIFCLGFLLIGCFNVAQPSENETLNEEYDSTVLKDENDSTVNSTPLEISFSHYNDYDSTVTVGNRFSQDFKTNLDDSLLVLWTVSSETLDSIEIGVETGYVTYIPEVFDSGSHDIKVVAETDTGLRDSVIFQIWIDNPIKYVGDFFPLVVGNKWYYQMRTYYPGENNTDKSMSLRHYYMEVLSITEEDAYIHIIDTTHDTTVISQFYTYSGEKDTIVATSIIDTTYCINKKMDTKYAFPYIHIYHYLDVSKTTEKIVGDTSYVEYRNLSSSNVGRDIILLSLKDIGVVSYWGSTGMSDAHSWNNSLISFNGIEFVHNYSDSLLTWEYEIKR
jgi:hypothetical protein